MVRCKLLYGSLTLDYMKPPPMRVVDQSLISQIGEECKDSDPRSTWSLQCRYPNCNSYFPMSKPFFTVLIFQLLSGISPENHDRLTKGSHHSPLTKVKCDKSQSIFPHQYTGTGTQFVAYLSLSPTLNDNISLEKVSKSTLNANYIH